MKFCTNCGKRISNNIKFCPYCGAKQDPQPRNNNVHDSVGVWYSIWFWIKSAFLEFITFFIAEPSKLRRIIYGISQIGLFCTNVIIFNIIDTLLLRQGFPSLFNSINSCHIVSFLLVVIEDKLFKLLRRGYLVNFILIAVNFAIFYLKYHDNFYGWWESLVMVSKAIVVCIVIGICIYAGLGDDDIPNQVGVYHADDGDHPIYKGGSDDYYYYDHDTSYKTSHDDSNADFN